MCEEYETRYISQTMQYLHKCMKESLSNLEINKPCASALTTLSPENCHLTYFENFNISYLRKLVTHKLCIRIIIYNFSLIEGMVLDTQE